MARENFALQFLEALQHRFDVGITLLTLRVAAARPEAAVDLIDGRKGDAELAEPFDRFGHLFGVLSNERWVGAEVARGERLFGVKLRGVFDAGLLRFFHDGAVHAAARDHGVAAGHPELFKDRDLRALFKRRDRGGEARTACAHDDDVDGVVPLLGNGAEVGRAGRARKTDGRDGGGGAEELATGDVAHG